MSLILPLRPDLDHYTEQLTLDGFKFDFLFQWNERDSTWYMSIFDPAVPADTDGSRVAILAGIAIHVGRGLLNQFRMRERPLGEIIVLDSSNQDLDPGQRDLGERVQLVYLTQDETIAIAAAAGIV